jgi:hypothetical protein
VRQTQLATLRAIQDGADTLPMLALAFGTTHRVRDRLLRMEHHQLIRKDSSVFPPRYVLTAKASSLLARRAELDGET